MANIRSENRLNVQLTQKSMNLAKKLNQVEIKREAQYLQQKRASINRREQSANRERTFSIKSELTKSKMIRADLSVNRSIH